MTERPHVRRRWTARRVLGAWHLARRSEDPVTRGGAGALAVVAKLGSATLIGYVAVTGLISTLDKMPKQIAASIAAEAAERREQREAEATERRAQHQESRADAKEITAAVTAKTGEEAEFRSTVLGVVQGRWRCPPPRPCPPLPPITCPAPNVTVVAPPQAERPSGDDKKREMPGLPTRQKRDP